MIVRGLAMDAQNTDAEMDDFGVGTEDRWNAGEARRKTSKGDHGDGGPRELVAIVSWCLGTG